ncbi:hypothetical protein SAMN05444161_1694 [Rhizobiales bacterium GAS191]|nr:hypothetical protein SAMN05519103_00802 [Rhizobiales bacterium GAS113]SEC56589.1 hypothetical protein SAMN05519104_1623 [Rhizobiales bacterium GAS188]SEC71732.1 hypothetical protein SAMN05444161_1694 [Rhizobiales bacterium GAS191]
MSRLVRAATDAAGPITFSASPVTVLTGAPGAPAVAGAAAGQETQVDNYAARIVKYVPAEVIAFYLAADKLFVPVSVTPSAETSTVMITKFIDTHGNYFGIGIFLLALVATPIYIWQQAEKDQNWIVNGVMSTIAFVIWAYTTQGSVFYGNGFYDPRLASFAVLIYTLLSGFVVPAKGK